MSCSNKISPIDTKCSNKDLRLELPLQEYYEARINESDEKENFIDKLIVLNDCTQKYYGKVVDQKGLIIKVKSMTINEFEKLNNLSNDSNRE